MWSIIPYFVYLAALYVLVDRMRLEASLASPRALACWRFSVLALRVGDVPYRGASPQDGDLVVVLSVIDNLVKGASGQAAQNMNILFGLDERLGLSHAGMLP